jgi:hypothetical protein
MSAVSPSTPSPKIDSMPTDAIYARLTDYQKRKIWEDFVERLRVYNLVDEELENPGSDAISTSAFVRTAWKQSKEAGVERFRDSVELDPYDMTL